MKRVASAAVLAMSMGLMAASMTAAENWSEIKSPHFTVWTDSDDRNTRALIWQLEQIRSALATLWPWARVELTKPLLVLAVKDEQSMKRLVPRYWEQKGSVRPASVWVSGTDQHYLAIRADQRGDDTATLNPHTSAYFSYSNLILQQSFSRDVPMWFSRGLAGVLSNTLVRNNHILLGAPIPWHLERLREGRRFSLKEVVELTRGAPRIAQAEGLASFDAQAWAFVHYLMFGDNGVHRAKLNLLADMLNKGADPAVAFSEAVGAAESFDAPLSNYIQRNLFAAQKITADASVARERFAGRKLPAAESAGGRAAFHVAMRRPSDARALIEEARKADPNAPGSYVAEGLQFDMAGNREEAKAAFARAADLGSLNAYAHYRAATLNWPRPDQDTLKTMEKDLARAVELNPLLAPALAALGEVRAHLKQPAGVAIPLIAKAISLEPWSPWHRLTAARVLWRFENIEEARKAAQAALTLADSDESRTEAQKLLASIGK
jgi:tetratricopeptide (TPR) repeat protein